VQRDSAVSGEAKKAIVGSSLGSALEWVDFTAYGAVSATVFPKLFFPTLDPSTAILASFATFGVGFLPVQQAASSLVCWAIGSGARRSCSPPSF
jgi:hypothetical protein